MTTTIWTDEALGLAVVWHGGETFNVHTFASVDENPPTATYALGGEVDAFTHYGTDQSTDLRPTAEEAAGAALAYFARLTDPACEECGAEHGQTHADGCAL